MSYKHLTLQERYLINAYKDVKTQKEIAKMIGVHPSTVSKNRGLTLNIYLQHRWHKSKQNT